MKTLLISLIALNILFLYELFGAVEIVAIVMLIELVYFSLAYFIEKKTHLIKRWLLDD